MMYTFPPNRPTHARPASVWAVPLLALLLALAGPANAQINYFEDFEADDGGWNLGSGGARSNNAPCDGSWSLRWSASSPDTWTIISPNIGTSSGEVATLSFRFKRSSTTSFGYLRSWWATSPAGPWNNQVTYSASGTVCNTYSTTFTPTAGQPIYVRLEVNKATSFSRTWHFDNVSLDQDPAPVPCTGTPDAGTVSPATAYGCPGGTVVLSSNANNVGVADITYQWEQSNDGVGGWTDAVGGSGANTVNYTTPAWSVGQVLYYRMTATCDNTADSDESNVAQVNGLTYAVFDGVSYTESFESWVSLCGNSAAPSQHWRNNGHTCSGAGCATAVVPWRRHDQGMSTGGWANNSGAYSPVASDGSYSARFHSYNSGIQSPVQTVIASMDLFIDMSAVSASSLLLLDHINTGGSETLTIHLSTNGGASFTQVGDAIGISSAWTEYAFVINSTSATTVIRIEASRTGTDTSGDIGIDNLRILGPCSGVPGAGSIAGNLDPACPSDNRTLTFTPDAQGGLSWVWQSSTTSGSGFTDIGGTTDLAEYETGPNASTLYYRVLTTCVPTSDEATSGEFTVTRLPGPLVEVAPASETVCAGGSVQLTASGSTEGYTWAASPHLNTTVGAVVTATPPVIGTFRYTVTSNDIDCPGSATAVIGTIDAPYGASVSPPAPVICENGNVLLTAIRGISTAANVGTAGGTENGDNTPFARTSFQRRVQYTLSVAQLTAAGIPAGANLNSLSFFVTDAGSGGALTNFSVALANPTTFVTVLGPTSYEPVVGQNAFVFSSPFTWNGTSSLVVRLCYNSPGGASPTVTMGGLSGSRVNATSTTGTGCTASGSSSSGTSTAAFPLMNFGYTHTPSLVPDVAWSPGTGLDATTGSSVTVSGLTQGSYPYDLLISLPNGCTTTAAVTVEVDPLPSVTVTPPVADAICEHDASATLDVGALGMQFATLVGWVKTTGAGDLTDAATPTPTYTPNDGSGAETAVLTVTVTSSNVGCGGSTATATWSVPVNARPTAAARVGTTPGFYDCTGITDPDVYFDLTGAPPFSLGYSYNNGAPPPPLPPSPLNVPGFIAQVPNAFVGFFKAISLVDDNGCVAADPIGLGGQVLGGPYINHMSFLYEKEGPQTVTWTLHHQATGIVVQNGQLLGNAGTMATCLPDGCYYLRVQSDGSGMDGGYTLLLNNGDRLVDNRLNFLSGSSSAIAGNEGFCLPLGMDRPIYTSCDKEWWKTGEFLVATENPAVSATWVNGPNTAQDPNSGYEFWFYDPNGGYSFRRFRPHTESDGYASVGATRACHVRLNNWAAANHLPEGRLLNVKVRGRVNGVNQTWGTACRFALDNALGDCPPTKLMDIPGHAQYSCGEVRPFARGQRVYARPVRGATHYQWRFRIPAESFVEIVTTNSHNLHLWTVPGLEAGKTYDVEVRVSKDGTTTWCGLGNQNPEVLNPAWGDICLLTLATPMTGPEVEGIADGGALKLWPNPNRGDQLWINLDGIAAGVETVTVDLYDLSGKRIAARVLPTQGEHLNTVIDLNGDLAGGMYLVHVTAGERTYIERLVVQP